MRRADLVTVLIISLMGCVAPVVPDADSAVRLARVACGGELDGADISHNGYWIVGRTGGYIDDVHVVRKSDGRVTCKDFELVISDPGGERNVYVH